MSLEKEEKLIQELMAKSQREMPFADFEERLMLQIHKEERTSRSFWKDIRLSWFFFVVGTLFGLFLNILVAEMNKPIFGLPAQGWILFIQAIFVIFLLFQFDKLIGLTRKDFNSFFNTDKADNILS